MRRKESLAAKPAVFAIQLLGVWHRISRGHVALSGGCSCGVASTGLRVQDFEEQILEYLSSRHGTSASSIGDLLAGIARSGGGSSAGILSDLKRTFDSFEQQHSGR